MIEHTVEAGVLRVGRAGARWLSTGVRGGIRVADAAYNVSVPADFDRSDLERYAAERLDRAGFDGRGPVFLTGVDLAHARGARSGPVTVVATAGLSNPAALPLDGEATDAGDPDPDARNPVDPDGDARNSGHPDVEGGALDPEDADSDHDAAPPGTVNLVVVTDRALDDGALPSLLATAVEAKTATLLGTAGFTGTTSDAVAVGCDPEGEPTRFAGSATTLGKATRACVRDAVRASLRSRYADRDRPTAVADAEYGTVTREPSTVFVPR
ncbi:adenosylcobinamide amidohydrolase [Halobacteriales archaeon QS_1_68_17]|nr:MAG: adenosylcobinamide amidohydrolase [Halobacteriales archaeon QS_1_68_17]